MAPILTIFGPNRSQRRNLFFEKFSNERRRHRGIVVVVIVAVVVAVVVVIGRFWVACIKGTSLIVEGKLLDHELPSLASLHQPCASHLLFAWKLQPKQNVEVLIVRYRSCF